jgi:hypothetical protein
MSAPRYVLFYSNRCEHSKTLLTALVRDPVNKEVAYVCVDRREREGNATFALLENGRRVQLPAELTEVPAVLLIEKGNALVSGTAISAYLPPPTQLGGELEPAAYSFTEMGGLSDAYGYLDVSSQDMLAQGGGGERMMHSYATLYDSQDIQTPVQADDQVPKVGASDMDERVALRAAEAPAPLARV